MERRSISEESLKELIDNVDLKETYLRSLPDTTFQEQQLTNLLANQKYTLQFFASLIQQVIFLSSSKHLWTHPSPDYSYSTITSATASWGTALPTKNSSNKNNL